MRVICTILAMLIAATALGAEVAVPDSGMSAQRQALHALNRLGFGPRPGEVERVRRQGVARWIEAQLDPDSIPDGEVERRLTAFHAPTLEPVELFREMPPPQLLRQIVKQLSTRAGMDSEAILSVLPEAEPIVARAAGKQSAPKRTPMSGVDRELGSARRVTYELAESKMLRAVLSERQLQELLVDFWFNHFNVYAAKGDNRLLLASYERDAIRPHALGRFRDLLGATAKHPAMLTYLDNWLSVAEGSRSYGLALRLPAARRTRELGLPPGGVATLVLRDRGVDTSALEAEAHRREQRLLRAAARRRRAPRQGLTAIERASQPERPLRGLNENYARELLELHTLGVDGGYSQTDIVEVARCLTGWTVLPIHAGRGFVYVDELHDRGRKVVLGKPIEGSGLAEGEEVLDRLARHPATARFISTKLARRFVADDPPPALVERMAARFLESDGDIRAVLRTLFSSPEFWSEESYRAKVKTPFELTASMLRATGATINHDARLFDLAAALGGPAADSEAMRAARVEAFPRSDRPPRLERLVRRLGQPLYLAQPPTGYPDRAQAWISTGSLLDRMKVAQALAGNRLPGLHVPRPSLRLSTAELAARLLGEPLPPRTLEAIEAQLDPELEPGARARTTIGWVLAAPEFQRR